MLPLRHAGLWRFLSALLLLGVLVSTLSPAFWFDSKVKALSWFENADKWLHGVTFLFLSIWFAGLYARATYWRIALALTLFGAVVEGCQILISSRTADWLDIAANTTGIIVGLAVALAGLGGWCLWLENRYLRLIER